jgi:hypothetical protein
VCDWALKASSNELGDAFGSAANQFTESLSRYQRETQDRRNQAAGRDAFALPTTAHNAFREDSRPD